MTGTTVEVFHRGQHMVRRAQCGFQGPCELFLSRAGYIYKTQADKCEISSLQKPRRMR